MIGEKASHMIKQDWTIQYNHRRVTGKIHIFKSQSREFKLLGLLSL